MSGDIPALPQYAFMAWCLVKHKDNFTFTLPYLRVIGWKGVDWMLLVQDSNQWRAPLNREINLLVP
jgi:hypothetical protein